MSILVVDDDNELRETVRDLLADEGYTTAGAANGEEALAYLRTEARPSLILLDLSMPVMDGIAFRQAQRADATLSSIPVVIFSAAAQVAEKVRDLGVAAVLAKPIKLEQLLGTISKFVPR